MLSESGVGFPLFWIRAWILYTYRTYFKMPGHYIQPYRDHMGFVDGKRSVSSRSCSEYVWFQFRFVFDRINFAIIPLTLIMINPVYVSLDLYRYLLWIHLPSTDENVSHRHFVTVLRCWLFHLLFLQVKRTVIKSRKQVKKTMFFYRPLIFSDLLLSAGKNLLLTL